MASSKYLIGKRIKCKKCLAEYVLPKASEIIHGEVEIVDRRREQTPAPDSAAALEISAYVERIGSSDSNSSDDKGQIAPPCSKKTFRFLFITISVVLFGVSLFCECVYVGGRGVGVGIPIPSGLVFLVMGWLSLFGFYPFWLVNPAILACWICFWPGAQSYRVKTGPGVAPIFALLALGLSLSFLSYRTTGPGSQEEISGYGIGYWLWVASMGTMFIGTVAYWIVYPILPAKVPRPQSQPVQRSKSFFGRPRLTYNCPSCNERLRSPLDEAGMKDTCPNCSFQFTVPGEQKAPSGTPKNG